MKKYRLRLFVYFLIFMLILSILGFSCFNTWKKIYANKKMAQELTQKYNDLLDNEEKLEGQVVKLQDPEYVAKYAREKYLFTRDGEYIIDLDDVVSAKVEDNEEE